MKSKFIFLALTFITGCIQFPNEFRYSPFGLDATILTSYSLINYTTTEIIYEVKVANFNYYNDLYYEGSSYALAGPGNLQVLQIEGMEINNNATSSNVVLIDQSGSYSEIDPHNLRSKIINKFLDDFDPPDNHLLGGYSSNGLLADYPVSYASPEFTSEWSNPEFLFDLPKLTGGNCALYDAINSAIDKLSPRSEINKNIVVLIHADDGGSFYTVVDLINKAGSNNIKIFLMVLGSEPTLATLWDLSHQTNGMLAYCPQDRHMVTILNHLQRLIKGSVYISRLRISFKPESGSVANGEIYENQVKIVDPFSGYEFNPVYIKIKIP